MRLTWSLDSKRLFTKSLSIEMLDCNSGVFWELVFDKWEVSLHQDLFNGSNIRKMSAQILFVDAVRVSTNINLRESIVVRIGAFFIFVSAFATSVSALSWTGTPASTMHACLVRRWASSWPSRAYRSRPTIAIEASAILALLLCVRGFTIGQLIIPVFVRTKILVVLKAFRILCIALFRLRLLNHKSKRPFN